MIRLLDPGSPVAPPPWQLLLLLSRPEPLEPLHRLTLYQRDREMEAQRSHSRLSAPPHNHFPQSSSPSLQTLLLPHLPFPLNLQSPAGLGPGICSFDEPGHERARATPRLLQSSLEIHYCWRAASHSDSWQGNSDSGTEEWVGTLVAWMC